jgi:hypothetical protein
VLCSECELRCDQHGIVCSQVVLRKYSAVFALNLTQRPQRAPASSRTGFLASGTLPNSGLAPCCTGGTPRPRARRRRQLAEPLTSPLRTARLQGCSVLRYQRNPCNHSRGRSEGAGLWRSSRCTCNPAQQLFRCMRSHRRARPTRSDISSTGAAPDRAGMMASLGASISPAAAAGELDHYAS